MNEIERKHAKRAVVQPMRVRWADGRVEDVCCGPAACTAVAAGAVGYVPEGAAVEGRCCHR